MWEPKTSEEFVGYFATKHFDRLIKTGQMDRVFCFYGAEAEDVRDFTTYLQTLSSHEEIWEAVIDNPIRALMAAWMWLDEETDTGRPAIAVTAMDFTSNKTEQFALPFRKKAFMKAFQIEDPITYQVTGELAENATFYLIALFAMYEGAKHHPAYADTWGKHYAGELFKENPDRAKLDAHPNSPTNMRGRG